VKFIVFELTMVDGTVSHRMTAESSQVVLPISDILGPIAPSHFSNSVSFIKLPVSLVLRLVNSTNRLVQLIENHSAFSASFSIFKHACVRVSTLVDCFTVSLEP
jgi:hypothetical protein